ncbi:hypothetical protein AB1Y20_002373 [Prymnesium parvum]|uniref:Uncharacterized protein n=1 Tax=Prymnesium parvum TaxID=97485 RepID=A0AB34J8X1_PRYPA
MAASDVAPLSQRMRDHAIVAGSIGAYSQAIHAARHGVPVLHGAFFGGAACATIAASFIGTRHLLLQGQWHEDREGVSGLAASIVGGSFALVANPRMVGHAAGYCFLGGCMLHYAHRWWLHYRLAWQMGWRLGD